MLLFLYLGFFSCKGERLEVKKSNPEIELRNGVLYYKGKSFYGSIVSSFQDGTIKSKSSYVDGRKDGEEKIWYNNGQVSQIRLYEQGIKIGRHFGWWENGTAKFEFDFNEKGEYHGSFKEWYKNGQLLRDFNCVNGKEVGRQRMWTITGKIRANYEVKNGERFGLIGLKKCYTVNIYSNELK